MTLHEVADYSELVQGLLMPLLAFGLAAEAMLMRVLARQILLCRLELEALKRAVGLDVSITPKP